MALYLYLKSEVVTYQDLEVRKLRTRTFGLALLVFGFLLASSQLWPIVYWQLHTLPTITSQMLLNPKTDWQTAQLKNVSVKTDSDGFTYFVNTNNSQTMTAQTDKFLLTIPKLGVEDADVLINSQQFDQNLAHFPGTVLPGQDGNVFVTGHSVLPQFFNPKDYKTIFSTLANLSFGDLAIVQYHNKTYRYQVINLKLVKPDNISVLLPIDDFGKYLTLMTCTPPGLNTSRLIVTARLMENPDQSDFVN